jgi:PAS domain S-box-containing protein
MGESPHPPAIRILMLEDSALDAELIVAQLKRAHLSFATDRVWTREDFLHALERGGYDVILADHVLPGFDGDTALTLAREQAPDIPFIFVSGTLTEELAVQALTRGARDYVVKQRLQRLPDAVLRALAEREERDKLASARAELQQSRDRLQLITDSLPALISHLGPDHRFRFVNPASLDWYGMAPEAMVGLSIQEVVGEAAFERARPNLERLLRGERINFESHLTRADGSVRYAQVDGVPERDAQGTITGYYTLARDISDLKHAEMSLRQINESLEHQVLARTADLRRSESRLHAVFQSSFQHQNLLTIHGDIVQANAASLAAILSTLAEVAGQAFPDSAWFATTPGASEWVREAVAAAAQGRESRHELELQLPTGTRSFDFSFRPLHDPDGQVSAIVSEAVETTARRQAEAALRQSQKIEAVGQLTGGIAHDFNNILTIIAGNIEHARLMIDHLGEPAARPARALDNAMRGVSRAAALTQRLLAFARQQPLQSQAVDIGAHMRGMQDMLQRALGELVRLQVDVPQDAWCVELDPAQLESAILNLAVNARDAMPEGGTLSIEAGNVHLDEDYAAHHPDIPEGDYVRLRIRDTGHGMSHDTMTRVFEPFFTTKEVGRGTGLGLPMVYGFVKQSGGHVLLDSTPGVGTVVTLLFPRSALPLPLSDETEAPLMAGVDAPEETLLVAEDNDDVRAYTVEALRHLGYRVLEAHDGASALRLLERPDVRVDLLLSDIVMPGMSGWELTQQAKLRKPGLRVLLTSGYPRDMAAHGSVARGMTILAKPFTRADLAGAVRRALENPVGSLEMASAPR